MEKVIIHDQTSKVTISGTLSLSSQSPYCIFSCFSFLENDELAYFK